MKNRFLRLGSASSAFLALTSLAVLAPAAENARSFYAVKNRTSDDGAMTRHTDANLINAWGLAAGPGTPWWVANNGTATSTLYLAGGQPLGFLVVQVPGAPTGIVYNGGTHFRLKKGRRSSPAAFLFASEDGTISGWSAKVPGPILSHDAVVVVDSSLAGAIYKGLAIASTPDGDFLYAADFHNGRVDVFDGDFNAAGAVGAFVDPNLPSGFAPFGIQNIGGHIFVAYAKQDAEGKDEVQGPGLGYVSEFDAAGMFVARVASGGALNAPWGLAMAPAAGFGPVSGHLLVGNFGDGRINAYEAAAPHTPKGPLRNKVGLPIAIDGLWGIAFGNGGAAGPTSVLYFTAGPQNETHGLFGSIKVGQTRF
jgi:uncharacterized protein (TIGR03118 family)